MGKGEKGEIVLIIRNEEIIIIYMGTEANNNLVLRG